MSHLTWNQSPQHTAAAASKLPGNETVKSQNTAIAS